MTENKNGSSSCIVPIGHKPLPLNWYWPWPAMLRGIISNQWINSSLCWYICMRPLKLRTVVMPTLSSLVAPKVVIMATSGATSHGKVGIKTTLSFQFQSELGVYWHDDVIKWKHFPCYWPFLREYHRSRWIPCTKASDAVLWCFLWSSPE